MGRLDRVDSMTASTEKTSMDACHDLGPPAALTKVAWRLLALRQVGWRNAVSLAAKDVAYVDYYYVLYCNLATLPETTPKRLGDGQLQLLHEGDMNEIVALVPTLAPSDRRDLLSFLRFWVDGFKDCYGLRIDGNFAYLQWLVYPSVNELLRRQCGRRFRPLQSNEVMIENAFTFPAYRGWGLLPSVTVELLKQVREEGFTRAVCYVRKDRIQVLNHFLQVGFKIFELIPEFRVLGCIWRRL
jgi:hypothetical protein